MTVGIVTVPELAMVVEAEGVKRAIAGQQRAVVLPRECARERGWAVLASSTEAGPVVPCTRAVLA